MGGTLAQLSFATLVEITINKRSAYHMTLKYAVIRVRESAMQYEGCAAKSAIVLCEEAPLAAITTAGWATKGGTLALVPSRMWLRSVDKRR